MLLITCPWCGPRDETEYSYGGQAHVAYPEDPHALTDEQWAEYLFFRDNPKGAFAERWVHSTGCRRWFNAVRDTVTYAITATYRPGEPPSGELSPADGATQLTANVSGAAEQHTPALRLFVPIGGSR